jgi:hypothetical protein
MLQEPLQPHLFGLQIQWCRDDAGVDAALLRAHESVHGRGYGDDRGARCETITVDDEARLISGERPKGAGAARRADICMTSMSKPRRAKNPF